jgi:hypothetical protein
MILLFAIAIFDAAAIISLIISFRLLIHDYLLRQLAAIAIASAADTLIFAISPLIAITLLLRHIIDAMPSPPPARVPFFHALLYAFDRRFPELRFTARLCCYAGCPAKCRERVAQSVVQRAHRHLISTAFDAHAFEQTGVHASICRHAKHRHATSPALPFVACCHLCRVLRHAMSPYPPFHHFSNSHESSQPFALFQLIFVRLSPTVLSTSRVV